MKVRPLGNAVLLRGLPNKAKVIRLGEEICDHDYVKFGSVVFFHMGRHVTIRATEGEGEWLVPLDDILGVVEEE